MWMWRLIDFYILAPSKKRQADPSYVRHREYSDYLTNWGDTLVFLYLFYATFIVAQSKLHLLEGYLIFSSLRRKKVWNTAAWKPRKVVPLYSAASIRNCTNLQRVSYCPVFCVRIGQVRWIRSSKRTLTYNEW